MSLEENLCVALFIMVVVVDGIGFMCGYVCGKDMAKEELVQELCSKTEYDFCVKVPQKPVYVLKEEKLK